MIRTHRLSSQRWLLALALLCGTAPSLAQAGDATPASAPAADAQVEGQKGAVLPPAEPQGTAAKPDGATDAETPSKEAVPSQDAKPAADVAKDARALAAERARREAVSLGPPPAPPALGDGFHLFDRNYVLIGVNLQSLCQATSLELEASFVPWISEGMFWGGLFAGAGFQRGRPPGRSAPSQVKSCFADADLIRYRGPKDGGKAPAGQAGGDGFRLTAGGELGWRMVAADLGVVYNSALVGQDIGFRGRIGLALADEVFTGSMVKYGKHCCYRKPGAPESVVPCECERTPVGISLFLYYGPEVYYAAEGSNFEEHWWADHIFGLSLKVGFGTKAWCGGR